MAIRAIDCSNRISLIGARTNVNFPFELRIAPFDQIVDLVLPFDQPLSRAIQSNKDLETTLSTNNRADLLMSGAKFQEIHSKLGTLPIAFKTAVLRFLRMFSTGLC